MFSLVDLISFKVESTSICFEFNSTSENMGLYFRIALFLFQGKQ